MTGNEAFASLMKHQNEAPREIRPIMPIRDSELPVAGRRRARVVAVWAGAGSGAAAGAAAGAGVARGTSVT